MDHRYRGKLKFERGNTFGGFNVEQCEPKPAKLGIGPYCVYYKDRVVIREQFQGECKKRIENLVYDHHRVARKIRNLQAEFVEKRQLTDFPESL